MPWSGQVPGWWSGVCSTFARAAGSDLFPPQKSLTSFKKSKMFPREFGSAGRGARSRGKGKLLNGGPVSAAPSAGQPAANSRPPQNSLNSFKKSKIFPREFGSAGRSARSRVEGKLLGGGPVSAPRPAPSRGQPAANCRPPQNSLTSFKKSKIFPREFGSAGRGARSRGKGNAAWMVVRCLQHFPRAAGSDLPRVRRARTH